MSTQQSQIRSATVEENAEALWKAAESLGISMADFMKVCKYAADKTAVESFTSTLEPDLLAEDRSAEGPHSVLTPGR